TVSFVVSAGGSGPRFPNTPTVSHKGGVGPTPQRVGRTVHGGGPSSPTPSAPPSTVAGPCEPTPGRACTKPTLDAHPGQQGWPAAQPTGPVLGTWPGSVCRGEG